MNDRLRAIDLARAAGVSVQQVRNYVEAGLLPPVERTASGYRIFTSAHAEALATAREVAAGHGWPTARVVMPAVHAGDLEAALAALDASHARLDRERRELAAVHEALGTILAAHTTLSAPTASPANAPQGTRIGQVARSVGVRPPVLRLWETHGLLKPDREPSTGYRNYSRAELDTARVIALLRRGNHPLATINAVVNELRSTSNPDRVLDELTNRARELHRSSLRRLKASAVLHAYLRYLGQAA
ncbi:MerR family transcriptional regulator [Actinopolymorpha alba]|uniref:MerR family transcriptional regulator n=1 Tax=Actinopolymorpha alba TaxID=533267 RepID=UPI00036E5A9B|nr:MerR family transcriptional regulator [Actinopolymorpha alba]